MKGFVIERNIKLNELPGTLTTRASEPKPQGSEVLVDVHVAGCNLFDALQVQGLYQHKPAFPFVAGCEFSGTISPDSPLPKGCPYKHGQKVFGAGQGAYAERIKVDYKSLVPVPDNVTMEQAAGLYITYPTSYAALVYRAEIKKGEYLLVHAAAGGVGMAALQIGKALDAKVIAMCSTQDKLDVCTRAGADFAINYADEKSKNGGWQKQVMAVTNGHGADVIYDPVGLLIPSLKCIAWNGRALVVGFAAGTIEKVPANLILLKNIAISGVHWGAYQKNQPEIVPATWEALLKLFSSGSLKAVVFDRVFEGLEAVPEALDELLARRTWGKAVVRVTFPMAKL
ncbi:NADPH2:quinone reductase [Microbotryum lychnidis-dioicae p1A1 Lamole]|uniref:NADPH2:quinone reductase n=1 Tax=Microbotryum lychnidis-dioicae (strain p1A1 Lamole / MvSl-1064) TaxID=683840 RepID=U5HCN7_USTV1|nr:NADPH2:quinone reductase [Microbotryum lychnidis-dioicae p1A1 Lamole]|eukprot:KDE04694.1 NADPH2:quinone reductase [Microbotryum lychnidis-dioicae p1A1 Lamole]